MRRRRMEIVEEDGYLIIDGRSWEHWTVAQLLDLTVELAEVRCGSWQLVQLATDAVARKAALAVYSADLRREVMAYRAIGFLRMILAPEHARATAPDGAGRIRAVQDMEKAGSAERLEYVLGCEIAGICPNGGDVPDPDKVTPREEG